MQKLMLTATAATALVMAAYTAFGQTTEVVAPGGATIVTPAGTTVVPAGTTTVINAPVTTYFTPAGVAASSPLTLGQLIAFRITDPDLASFKTALQNSTIPETFDPAKGYTVFAPLHYSGKEPVEHYIVNDRIAANLIDSTHDKTAQMGYTSLNGDHLRVTKLNRSHFVNNMRINHVDRDPEGVIYTVGGMQDASF
ncbi:MAG: hypothetical protein WDN72_04455 [Alphaproteobacteria bacterium]